MSIHERGHDMSLVVTQPDRPAGRGRKLTPSPVKVKALELDIDLAQPDSVNTEGFLASLRAAAPDVIVVVAFGQILSEELLGIPRLHAVNVHASLLPKYRGVAPINWAILNGETETGVTTMHMAKKVDAGDIILVRGTQIGEMETAGELYGRLSILGAELIAETLDLIEQGQAPRIAQDASQATYARKLKKEDGVLDWSESAKALFNRIRGLSPWPGAFTYFNGKTLKILEARVRSEPTLAGHPGEILSIGDKEGIEVAAGEGALLLRKLKPEGRKSMDASSFARGYRPEVGTRPFGRPE